MIPELLTRKMRLSGASILEMMTPELLDDCIWPSHGNEQEIRDEWARLQSSPRSYTAMMSRLNNTRDDSCLT